MSYLLWRTRVSHGVAEAEDEQRDHGGLVQPYEEAGWRGGMVEHAGELLSLTPWLTRLHRSHENGAKEDAASSGRTLFLPLTPLCRQTRHSQSCTMSLFLMRQRVPPERALARLADRLAPPKINRQVERGGELQMTRCRGAGGHF